jgi:hypothetical protein
MVIAKLMIFCVKPSSWPPYICLDGKPYYMPAVLYRLFKGTSLQVVSIIAALQQFMHYNSLTLKALHIYKLKYTQYEFHL